MKTKTAQQWAKEQAGAKALLLITPQGKKILWKIDSVPIPKGQLGLLGRID